MRVDGSARRSQHACGIFRSDEDIDDRSDDARARRGACLGEERIEPILGHEAVALVGTLQADTDDAPRAHLIGEDVFCILRPMCAKECAEAEMHDAWLQAGAVITWNDDLRAAPAEGCIGQPRQRPRGIGSRCRHPQFPS